MIATPQRLCVTSRIFVLAATAGMCAPALRAQVGDPAADAVTASVRAIVEPQLHLLIKVQGVPGLSCAVSVNEKMVFAEGYGFADLENDVPATSKTVYRLASISKPVTAVLLMQIAERGDLDLDAPVDTIVPEWPKKRWPTTSRQLLAHLGGVRHYLREGESTKRYANQVAGLARFAGDPLLYEPGTRYRYSTYGYNLLAAVVETHYEKPFGEVVRERLSAPCKAPSLQDDDQQRLIKHRAQGYKLRAGKLGNSDLMDGSYKLGGGGLCASAPDLARFAAALVAGRLVKKETLEEMWTVQQTRAGRRVGYGLGFRVGANRGQRVLMHGGAQSRVSTMLLMLPDDGIVVTLMSNLEGTKLSELARHIAFDVREYVLSKKP